MRTSELIKLLQAELATKGDLPVMLDVGGCAHYTVGGCYSSYINTDALYPVREYHEIIIESIGAPKL